MQIRDWFILTFTFVIAFFCGMYLYTTNFLPNYETGAEEEKLQNVDLLILGVQYGGFGRDTELPYFRVQATSEYDYFPDGDSSERTAGELPQSAFNRVALALADADLEVLSEPIEVVDCVSDDGGIDYEYTIEYLGTEYTLDTCTTAFSNDTEVGAALLPLWDYMKDPDTFSFSISNSPGGLDTADAEAAEEYGSSWTLRGYFERGFKGVGFFEIGE